MIDNLIIREAEAVVPAYEFMRFQVGFVESRVAMVPIYETVKGGKRGPKVESHEESPIGEQVKVFHLLGYGETEEEAWEMQQSVQRKAPAPLRRGSP